MVKGSGEYMAMDINIGNVSGCLEIIGDCIESEKDLQDTINQRR